MQYHRYDTIDSTNDQAKRLLAAGAITRRACVVAREQTAGRGTRGRTWSSPRDAGLYLSLAEVLPTAMRVQPGLITLAAGVACCEAIAEVTGLAIEIEPVNDLVVGGHKLGGILAEATWEQAGMRALVVGVGINVRHADRSVAGGRKTTSLEGLLGTAGIGTVDVRALEHAVAGRLATWNERALGADVDRIRPAWVRHAVADAVWPANETDAV